MFQETDRRKDMTYIGVSTMQAFYIPSRRSSKRQKTKFFLICFRQPVVFYGCETWSFTLTEELRSKVFEKRVLRRIFGPKIDQLILEWRKLHNEEL
jgi:hypothetical protein